MKHDQIWMSWAIMMILHFLRMNDKLSKVKQRSTQPRFLYLRHIKVWHWDAQDIVIHWSQNFFFSNAKCLLHKFSFAEFIMLKRWEKLRCSTKISYSQVFSLKWIRHASLVYTRFVQISCGKCINQALTFIVWICIFFWILPLNILWIYRWIKWKVVIIFTTYRNVRYI